jgi:membrane fusion protein (multidrug efflux system)
MATSLLIVGIDAKGMRFMIRKSYFQFVFYAAALLQLIPIGMDANGVGALPPKVVETVQIKREEISEIATLIGRVQSKSIRHVVSQASGTFKIHKEPGSHVTQGTLYAQIIDEEIDRKYELAVEKERISRDQYERSKSLVTPGAMSQNALEASQQELLAAQLALASAKIERDRLLFTAPFDGMLGIYQIRDGGYLSAGDPVVSLFDPKNLYLELSIPISMLQWTKLGQSVQIPSLERSSHITHLQKMVDSGSQMCPAWVELTEGDLLIGQPLTVGLVLRTKADALVVSTTALFLRDGRQCVYVVDGDKAKLVPVEVGLEENNRVELVSGVKEGDQVIVRGQSRLYPGITVKNVAATSEGL